MSLNAPKLMLAHLGRWAFGSSQRPGCRMFVRNHYRKWCIDRELDTTTRWGFRMGASPYDYASYGIFFFGEYDPRMSDFMRLHVKEGQTAWDIGAERGWFSLLMGKAVGPTGRVDSFEAFAPNAQRLRQNIARNAMNHVHVHELAVSDRAGTMCFEPPSDQVTGNVGFLEGCSGVGYLTAEKKPGTIEVPTIGLDDFAEQEKVERVDFIKLDIEGAEVAALRGGDTILRQHRPILAVEYNRATLHRAGTSLQELDDLIASFNYDRYALRGTLKKVDLKEAEGQRDEDVVFNVYCFPRRSR